MKRYVLIQSCDLAYSGFLELSYARHAQYAQRCGADYLIYTGLKDEHCHPSWNRIALLQEGMAQGYEKLVWLDADALVVDLARNIFTETRDDVSIQMCRYDNYLWHGQPHYNAGVMVVRAGEDAMALLHEVWNRRDTPLRPHHVPTFWEQNWVGDYVTDHPKVAAPLPQCWNYVARYATSREPVVIQGFHGEPDRLALFRQALTRINGHGATSSDQMPEADWMPGDPWKYLLHSRPSGRDYYPSLTRMIRQYGVQSVVEIGVRAGYSMAAMLRGNPKLIYVGIDDARELGDKLKHAEALAHEYTRGGSVQLCLSSSHDLMRLPRSFDLAYIDGDHSFDACAHDLELCAKSCTYILCDDYDYAGGVREAVQRFCTTHRLPLTYLPTVHGWALLDMRQIGTATDTQLQWSPARQGERMKYYCTAVAPTYHHVLLTLEPGMIYEFDDAQIEAAEAMVTAGALRHLDELDLSEAEPEQTDAPAEDVGETPAVCFEPSEPVLEDEEQVATTDALSEPDQHELSDEDRDATA